MDYADPDPFPEDSLWELLLKVFLRLGRQICKSVSDPDSGVFLIRIRSQHHYYPTRHR